MNDLTTELRLRNLIEYAEKAGEKGITPEGAADHFGWSRLDTKSLCSELLRHGTVIYNVAKRCYIYNKQ